MSSGKETFGCALNCMDGRSVRAVDAWMRTEYGVDWVDQPTLPGMDKVLTDYFGSLELRKSVEISAKKHNASRIAVVGHEDCAANPCSKEEHVECIKKGVERVRGWNLGVPVVGLWVYPIGDEKLWRVEIVVPAQI